MRRLCWVLWCKPIIPARRQEESLGYILRSYLKITPKNPKPKPNPKKLQKTQKEKQKATITKREWEDSIFFFLRQT
jgi:hypothetical protein